MKRWVRRRDGVRQRYHVGSRGHNRRVSVVFDRYRNLDFVDQDGKVVAKDFKDNPELIPYVLLLSNLGAETGAVLDDGNLPSDFRLHLQMPWSDYSLLVKKRVLEPVEQNGRKGYRVRTPADFEYLFVRYPFKGEKWMKNDLGEPMKGLPSRAFLRSMGLFLKRRARVSSNKGYSSIKNPDEMIALFSIIPFVVT